MKNFLVLLFVVFGFIFKVNAQIPCDEDTTRKTYYYESSKLTSFPPLNSGMPYDVILGYIVADSVLKTVNVKQIEDFFNRQDSQFFSDSLKYFFKYYYKIANYDPMVLHQYFIEGSDEYLFPNIVISHMNDMLSKNLDSGYIYEYILNSSYIFHVFINDTVNLSLESGSPACLNIIAANATVIDTLKGKSIPNIQNTTNITEFKKFNDKFLTGTGATFVFQYCKEWPISFGDKLLQDFVVPNQEYIVFLRIGYLCELTDKAYWTITPYLIPFIGCGLYRIENGMVLDKRNEWGLGTSVPINDFKNKVRGFISNIDNFEE